MLMGSSNPEIKIEGNTFLLLKEKAIFWKEQKALLLADLHLGKVNHFRKVGIPVPVAVNQQNLEHLQTLIHTTNPKRVILVGDLFHSHYNEAWEEFGAFVKYYPTMSFELVIGNHDILSDHQYSRKGIIVYEELQIENLLFTHHPMEKTPAGVYNLAGHIHPGVHLQGKARQSLTLPCFYFGKQGGVLPAFGVFTGLARIKPKKQDQVFVILPDKVVKME